MTLITINILGKAIIKPLNPRHNNIKPLSDIPKSWKFLKVYSHSLQNNYNQSGIKVYEVKDKTLRFSMFRDGCFYEYCGKLELI